MLEFKLPNTFAAIDDDCWAPIKNGNTLKLHSYDDIKLLIKKLTNFINNYDEDFIIKYNSEREFEFCLSAHGNYSNKTTGYIYIFGNDDKLKIGTSDNPHKRFYEISNNIPDKIDIIWISNKIAAPYAVERAVHVYLNKYLIKGEWFNATIPDYMLNIIKTVINNLSLEVFNK